MTELIALFIAIAFNVWFFAGYLGSGGTFPKPLTPEEEDMYLKRMYEGDMKAREILIERNLRLVAHVAKKYSSLGKDSEDLISIGTIGLIKGISSYSSSKGTKLATYAARCIDNEILMSIRSGKKLQNEVSIHEVIGTDKEGNNITLMDVIEDDDRLIEEKVDLKMRVSYMYKKMREALLPREFEIISKRFGLGNKPAKTQNDIANELGISRSYVSRIEKKAIEKLRNYMKN